MNPDNRQDSDQPGTPALRQPPSFVPTLTHMVQAAPAAAAESAAAPSAALPAALPAAFAELLKDWPVLGESAGPAEQTPTPAVLAPPKNGEDANAERIAQRAEALVLQRLPALISGLVSRSVRDAMAEVEADHLRLPKDGAIN